jgi:hypothetical protein
MITYILFCLFLAVACLSFAFGYRRGMQKGSKIISLKLAGRTAQEVFAYVCLHEKDRHRQDIAHINRDLKALDRMGIKPPDIPLGLWLEAQK